MKFKFFLLSMSILALFSCNEDRLNDEISETGKNLHDFHKHGESAFGNQIEGLEKEAYYMGEHIKYNKINGKNVFEGDILIADHQLKETAPNLTHYDGDNHSNLNRSVGLTSNLWPDNTVYYTIESSLPNKKRVTDAIAHWESKTNLKFVKRTNQQNYIYFQRSSGCSSYIGMIGGRQDINLANGCTTGSTIHEIGHAIGLFHEQSREDRDEYITIHHENIESGMDFNFESIANKGYDAEDLTNSIDFQSIMMYSPYAFSRNGRPTITKKDGTLYDYQRDVLSQGDINGVLKIYPGEETTGGGGGTTKPEPTKPEPKPEPEKYTNNTWYTIDGLRVYRYNDKWYYYYSYYRTWYEVVNIEGEWYYA